MTEISEDGFWQLVDEEWIPTQKQLDAIDSGAIPHEKALTKQSEEEIEDLCADNIKNIFSCKK